MAKVLVSSGSLPPEITRAPIARQSGTRGTLQARDLIPVCPPWLGHGLSAQLDSPRHASRMQEIHPGLRTMVTLFYMQTQKMNSAHKSFSIQICLPGPSTLDPLRRFTIMLSLALHGLAWLTPPQMPQQSLDGAVGRRAILAGGAFGAAATVMAPLAAVAQIESVNVRAACLVQPCMLRSLRVSDACASSGVRSRPTTIISPWPSTATCRASSVHVRTHRYRGSPEASPRLKPLSAARPRVGAIACSDGRGVSCLAGIAVDQLAPAALEVGDWEGMAEVVRRADDAITALPLYTNAVEGSRSGKRKKKTDNQKEMISDLKVYKLAIADLEKAVSKKDRPKSLTALKEARASLLSYRTIAQIDGEDGGVIQMPLGNAQEVCRRSRRRFIAAAPPPLRRVLSQHGCGDTACDAGSMLPMHAVPSHGGTASRMAMCRCLAPLPPHITRGPPYGRAPNMSPIPNNLL